MNIVLSEQEILACGDVEPYRLKGCAGGRPEEVMKYISDRGINIAKNYPYNGLIPSNSKTNRQWTSNSNAKGIWARRSSNTKSTRLGRTDTSYH